MKGNEIGDIWGRGDPAAEDFRHMDLKEEGILGDKSPGHWYYVAKGRALCRMLGGRQFGEVLDVGAGSGTFSKLLLDRGMCTSAVCLDPHYAQEHAECHRGAPIRFVRSVGQVTQSLILMMDVLEHVEDDIALVRSYTDAMPEDATLLVTVPAFEFIWSGHDVFLEHYRRYTRESLTRSLEAAGLKVTDCRYFYASVFPVAALKRIASGRRVKDGSLAPKSDLRLYPGWLNQIFVSVLDAERIALFPFNRFLGLTVFATARRA